MGLGSEELAVPAEEAEGRLVLPGGPGHLVSPSGLVELADGPEELFRLEYEGLVRLALRLVDSRERAEELVQEAFERAIVRWDRLDNPAAYIRTVVVNGCRGELRRRAILRRFEARPADRREPAEATEILSDALAHLAPRRRIALVLRFYADLPEREIAEHLGVAPGTVKSLISRGLADLRKAVEP